MAASCDRLLMVMQPLLVSQKGYWIVPSVTIRLIGMFLNKAI